MNLNRMLSLIALVTALVVLAGCGGSGPDAPALDAPSGGEAIEVGPMLVRPASTAGFTAQPLQAFGSCAFVALHGARIDLLASQAMLDRIVFTSDRDGFNDIWVCNMDGSGLVHLTNNGASEKRPEWSPDGTMIVFDRQWPGQDTEIMTMRADGSTIRTLTNNADADSFPTFSPDGRRIAFDTDRDGNWEIYTMYADGSSERNMTNHASDDRHPSWSPRYDDPEIAFVSDRLGDFNLYLMNPDGTGAAAAITSSPEDDFAPCWNLERGYTLAFQRWASGDNEIFTISSSGSSLVRFSNHPDNDRVPAWSTDGRWIAFASDRAGNMDIWVQQTNEPYRAFRVTTSPARDDYPHLGSPTMQTERVLIGPPGSDWGGLDPIWSSAYAGIVAFDEEGYRNFVRIGIAAADVSTLEVTPLSTPTMMMGGGAPVGVLVEARQIVNLREDAGRGEVPTVWDLAALDAGAVILYFDSYTGKLVSVLAVDDAVYPSAAQVATAVTQSAGADDGVVVSGAFRAVFDAEGNNLGEANQVAISTSGELSLQQ